MRTRRMRRELAADIEAHIAERTEELVESGMREPEARQQARREFGNPTLFAETGGEVWGWAWLENIGKDLGYAFRALRASPLFTITAVLSLALGIGANTAIFTLLYASLWKPLPVPAPQQIFQLWRHADAGPWTGDFGYSYDLYEHLRQASAAAGTGELFAKSSFGSDKFSAQGVSSGRIAGEAATANLFSVLGVRPSLGRVLEPADDSSQGGRPVAVLSYAFWMHRFHADQSVAGKIIYYNETPYTVVGVAQPGFTGIEGEASIDLWVPVTASVEKDWLSNPNVGWLRVAMRLRPDVPPDRAQALFEKAFRVYVADKLMPTADPHWRPVLDAQRITVRSATAGLAATGHKYEKALWLQMVLVALVLLIACANVANLIMARNHARQHEVAIRRALGAGRARIARQLFCESLLLAAAGAVCGLIMAGWGARVLISFLPIPDVPLAFDLRPGLPVFGFTALVAIATAVLFGLIPAWRAGGAGENLSLRASRRVTRANFGGKLLVAGQLALSLVLLIGAGLFVATLRNLKAADLGFRPDNVVQFNISFPKGTPDERQRQTYAQIKQRLESDPGVAAAAYAWPGIYGHGGWSSGRIEVEGHQNGPNEDIEIGLIAAGPGFFQALGMEVVQGRYLNAQDQSDKPPVAVVSVSFARYYFGGGSAIGRHFKLPQFPNTTREIVGVVRDARHYGVREQIMRMVYLPNWNNAGSFYVCTKRDAAGLSAAIRSGVAEADKTAQVEDIRSLDTAVNDMISQERLTATLSSAFGGLAVLLAAVGLYGVVAYSVARRTNEFGIRMALGAQRGDVLQLVLRQMILFVIAGVSIGLAAAAALTRAFSAAIAGMLYGINPTNAAIFAGAALLLAGVALLAAFLPARRASRIDPIVALRYE